MNSAAIKQLKKPKLWAAFVLIAVAVWVLAFYWIAQPTRSEKYEVWLGADFDLKTELKESVRAAAEERGIKKCSIVKYDPADSYYAQAFSLRANTVDLYLLTKDFAITIAETGIFGTMDKAFEGEEYLEIDGKNCGVRFKGDYYIFINSGSDKPAELHFAVINALLSGADV